MHETNKRILAELPATPEEIAHKLGLTVKTVRLRIRFLLVLGIIKRVGKKPTDGTSHTVYGELK